MVGRPGHSRDIHIINGNDIAAIEAAAAQPPQPSRYVYQQDVTVPSQNATFGNVVAAQITASSPIFDGAYPVAVGSDNVSDITSEYNSTHFFTNYQLKHPDVILSTLTFGITIFEDTSPVFIGTGSFDAQGNFHFQPNGNPPRVPTGATLYPDGRVALTSAAAALPSATAR